MPLMEHPHSSSPGGLQLWKHRGWGNFIWPASIAVLSGEQIQWPWCAGCGVFRSYKACLHRNLIRLLSGKGVDIRKPEMHLKQLSSPAKSGVFKAHKWAARLLAVCFCEAALMHPRSREPPLLFFPDGGMQAGVKGCWTGITSLYALFLCTLTWMGQLHIEWAFCHQGV